MKFIRIPKTEIGQSLDCKLINLEHIIAICKISDNYKNKMTYTIKFYGLYDAVFFWEFDNESERDRQYDRVVEEIGGYL